MTKPAKDQTVDAILGGEIQISQPRRGYRFSVDSVLLASLARIPSARTPSSLRVLELGAGCGVIAVLIARLYGPKEIVAIEIQPELAKLIQQNATRNRVDSIKVENADLRQRKIAGLAEGSFDWVIANPPYRALRTGRDSPNRGRRIARGESTAKLDDFIAAASRYCRFGERLAMVFGAARTAELVRSLSAWGFEPKRLRMIHPRIGAPANIVFIEARKGGGIELRVEPPLIIYGAAKEYTAEARRLIFGVG